MRWEAPGWLAIAVGLYVVLYVAWRHSPLGGVDRVVIDQLPVVAANLAAAVAAWFASRRCEAEPRTMSAWRLIAIGLLFGTAAFGIWAVYAIVGATAPIPSAAEACCLCMYVLLPVGLLRFPMREQSRGGRRRLLIDTITISIGTLSVVWFFVLGPTVAQGGSSALAVITAAGYPVADVVLLTVVTYVTARALIPATRFALRILVATLVLQVASDVAFSYLLLHSQWGAADVVRYIFVAVSALYVLGAASQRRLNSETLRESTVQSGEGTARSPGLLGRWLPYVVPAVVFGLLVGAQFGSAMYLRVGLAVCACIVAALVLARQFLAQRDLLSLQGELSHQALHDGLTGLPNRVLVLDRIEQLLARNRRSGTTGAVLFVDLDEFKNVNDTLGHEAGDRLLIAVTERFTNTLRDADTIGRMGGDEFVVLIDGATVNVAPELVAERLLAVMRQPFELDNTSMPLVVNTSIGIAMGDRPLAGELLRDADVALYQAKAKGKNRYEIFYPEMQTEISQRIELEFDLRSAIEEDQFRLMYQPIYNLDQLTIVGVEALLRWDHPTRGLVRPDEFIPVLEQTGQIREVGGWVLDQACQQMATWHERGDVLDLSVNVSGRQLDDDQIVDQIRHALEESGLPAASLIIEVTETALMRNADETAKRLHAIKLLGIRIAVDDFGTGYSSLAYLQQFPVDCLKIDQTFTSALSSSPESKALIGTLVQLGKDLGLTTLAEGLETTSQMDHLRGEHVNEAQGFLLSRPLEPDALETQLLIHSDHERVH